jgi:hypothetical protein
VEGGGGALAMLLEELEPKPWFYLHIQYKDYKIHGGMSCDD